MATLNVFELTNEELNKSKSTKTESKTTKTKKKTIKESKGSVKTSRKFRKAEKLSKTIPSNKLRLESLKFVEDAEENDEVIDYTPEEDVVLVIDPEMDETPETEEEAEEAAEELVGDYVCKCAICGANYICDCEEVNEDLESEEAECPICGETGEQIVVGEITPAEDVVDDEEDSDEEPVEDEPVEDEVADDDFADEEFPEDDFVDEEPVEDEDDEYEESISLAKRRTALRRESKAKTAKRTTRRPVTPTESRKPARKTRTVKESKNYILDEVTLNRMLTKFAKENYDNVRFVKITNGKCKNNKLTLEGTVITKKGSKRSTKFVCENFKPGAMVSAKFTEVGAFTENAISRGPAFTIDFRTRNNTITPVSLRYSYKVKENKERFLVSGKVVNESVKKTPNRKRTK